jgi:PAS domain S-box-containing protein
MTDAIPASVPWLTDLPLLTDAQRADVVSAFRRALVESPMPTVLCSTTDGAILGCNAQFEAMMGVPESALHGQRIEDVVHPADRPQTIAVLERLGSGESSRESYEGRYVRPDGRLVWVRCHILGVEGPAADGGAYWSASSRT